MPPERVCKNAKAFVAALVLPLCLIGMEACGRARHWARELMSLNVIASLFITSIVGRLERETCF